MGSFVAGHPPSTNGGTSGSTCSENLEALKEVLIKEWVGWWYQKIGLAAISMRQLRIPWQYYVPPVSLVRMTYERHTNVHDEPIVHGRMAGCV